MSSHADTIRRAIDYRSRFADKADEAIDALLAENQRYAKVLTRIGAGHPAPEMLAREALAGDADEAWPKPKMELGRPDEYGFREALAGDAE